MIRIGKERMPKKMLHKRMEVRRPRERPRTRWIEIIREDIEMRGEIGKIYKKTKWDNRENWRFLRNSRSITLEIT